MPDRVLRASILTSDTVNKVSWPSEVFYRRLMSIVDDYGRYDGRESILRAQLYPLRLDKVSTSDVGKWLGECRNAGLVRCYLVDGRAFIEIQKFNQRLRAKTSKWPEPPADCRHLTADDGHVLSDSAGDGDGDGDVPPKAPKGAGEGKSKTPTSDEARRIAAMFGRRETTEWSEKEIKAFRGLGKIDPGELDVLEAYHSSEKAKGDKGRHRRDLGTLLNNFRGEVDRARAWHLRNEGKHEEEGTLL